MLKKKKGQIRYYDWSNESVISEVTYVDFSMWTCKFNKQVHRPVEVDSNQTEHPLRTTVMFMQETAYAQTFWTLCW